MNEKDIFFNIVEQEVPMPLLQDGKIVGWDSNKPSNYKMLIREDTGNPLSVVTKDYRMITNADLVDACHNALKDDGAQLVQQQAWADRRFAFKFRFPNPVQIPHGGKWAEVYPELNVRNSYDATTGVYVLAGAFVFVCGNGLVIGVKAMRKNHHHIMGNEALKNLPEMFIEVRKLMTKIVNNEIPFLAQTIVHPEDVMWLMDEFPKRYQEAMKIHLFNSDSITNFWELYQLGTYTTTHIIPRKYESTQKLEDMIFQKILTRAKWREKN